MLARNQPIRFSAQIITNNPVAGTVAVGYRLRRRRVAGEG
jgi:hypothetical protein